MERGEKACAESVVSVDEENVEQVGCVAAANAEAAYQSWTLNLPRISRRGLIFPRACYAL